MIQFDTGNATETADVAVNGRKVMVKLVWSTLRRSLKPREKVGHSYFTKSRAGTSDASLWKVEDRCRHG